MFSNLSKGSKIYILEPKNNMLVSTGTVVDATMPMPKYKTINPNNFFGQQHELVMDISVTINGEKKDFKQVPSNMTIADFGPDSIVLADSRESMLEYCNSEFKKNDEVVNNIELYKTRRNDFKRAINQINPYLATSPEKDSAISALETKVNGLENDLKQALNLLKELTTKE